MNDRRLVTNAKRVFARKIAGDAANFNFTRRISLSLLQAGLSRASRELQGKLKRRPLFEREGRGESWKFKITRYLARKSNVHRELQKQQIFLSRADSWANSAIIIFKVLNDNLQVISAN